MTSEMKERETVVFPETCLSEAGFLQCRLGGSERYRD
jgi:hypothetical protein